MCQFEGSAAVWIRLSAEHTLNAAVFTHITAARKTCCNAHTFTVNLQLQNGHYYPYNERVKMHNWMFLIFKKTKKQKVLF